MYNYIWNNFGQGYAYSYKNKSVQPLSATNCFCIKKNPSGVFNKILNTSLHGGSIEYQFFSARVGKLIIVLHYLFR